MHHHCLIQPFLCRTFLEFDSIVFIGAMGICVRSIASCIRNKHKDPAVICVDSTGKYIIPVLSGHIGGANELSSRIAGIVGGEAIITTQSDNEGLWALDTLASRYGWRTDATPAQMNKCIFRFVQKRPTALLLEIKDKGTEYLEETLPEHVRVFYHYEDIPQLEVELIVAITPYLYDNKMCPEVPILVFYPPVLHLGIGCRKQCNPEGIPEYIQSEMVERGLSLLALASISTIELKKDEPLLQAMCDKYPFLQKHIYRTEELKDIEVPNPSPKAFEVTGLYGVAEASALKSGRNGELIIEKQKVY